MKDRKYIYEGEPFKDLNIFPYCYKPEYFDLAIELESDVYYEIRKMNNIYPHRLNESTAEELQNIREFFNKNKSSFFFLFTDNELIGNVLVLRNYIQSLAISRKYQRNGYGKLLTQYAINYVLLKGHRCVELKVLDGNIAAHRLYLKIGFKILE